MICNKCKCEKCTCKNLQTGPNPGREFAGDLQPGRGGSMLFGPGNPDFNVTIVLPSSVPGPGPGRVPGARFDPYGPSMPNTNGPGPNVSGNPNWDDVAPGRNFDK